MEDPSSSCSRSGNHVSARTRISDVRSTRRRILHRVPPQLRENKNHIYNPVILTLGPYHHSISPNSPFRRVEEFKNEVLDIILKPPARDYFRSMIMERVDEIRIFYEGVSEGEYSNEELTEMMLRDTCFVLYYMELKTKNMEIRTSFFHRLGLSVGVFLFHDMFMLENQIPLWVLNLLIRLKFVDADKGKTSLCEFFNSLNFIGYTLTRVPWEGKNQEPLHLLEALRIIMVKGEGTGTIEMHHKKTLAFSSRSRKKFEKVNSPFRSVMDLESKGICFKPSSNCLTDIRFNSYWLYGTLQLPIQYINHNSQAFFSNAIALEMCPESDWDFAVISYVNFMKSLIETPKDVKKLREKGILFSSLSNDKEVVKVFKGINTYGIDNTDIFQEVKMRINEHCKDKMKTWMAELYDTHFRTPWSIIALLAAIVLLVLASLQTYLKIKNP